MSITGQGKETIKTKSGCEGSSNMKTLFKYFFCHEKLALYIYKSAVQQRRCQVSRHSSLQPSNGTQRRKTHTSSRWPLGPCSTLRNAAFATLRPNGKRQAPRQVSAPVMVHTYIGRFTTQSSSVMWYPEYSWIISEHNFHGFDPHIQENS
jgi:hypothetical protein